MRSNTRFTVFAPWRVENPSVVPLFVRVGIALGLIAQLCVGPLATAVEPYNVDRLVLPIGGSLEIARVRGASDYRFDLETRGDVGVQVVAYYAEDGRMTVAARRLGEVDWIRKTLSTAKPTTFDGHDHLELGFDPSGILHFAGNMHTDALQYVRTTGPVDEPEDILTLAVPASLPWPRSSVTYPGFQTVGGRFIFTYREGNSSNGDLYARAFDPANGTWATPGGFAGPIYAGTGGPSGTENSFYASPPRRVSASGEEVQLTGVLRSLDGELHCDPNSVYRSCRLIYTRTSDFETFYGPAGDTLPQPMTAENLASTSAMVTFDPKGGLSPPNVNHLLSGDPVIAYGRYDAAGHSQAEVASWGGGQWSHLQLTNWNQTLFFSSVVTNLHGPFVAFGAPTSFVVRATPLGAPELSTGWLRFYPSTLTATPAPLFTQPPVCGQTGLLPGLEYPSYVHPELGARFEQRIHRSGRYRWDSQAAPGDDSGDFYFLRWEALEDTQFGAGGAPPPPGSLSEPPTTRLTLHRTLCRTGPPPLPVDQLMSVLTPLLLEEDPGVGCF